MLKDMIDAEEDFSKAIFNTTFEESQKVYNVIGKDLDGHMKVLGAVAHHDVALLFKKYAKDINPSLVLDLAGGTGYVSEHLRRDAEYKKDIDILDANMELLYLASKKSLGFRTIIQHSIADQLPVPDNSYDVVICLGSFLPNHLPPSSIPAIVRAVKPGGLFIFNLREKTTEEYNAEIYAMTKKCVDDGKMKLIEQIACKYSSNTDKSFLALVFVYRCI